MIQSAREFKRRLTRRDRAHRHTRSAALVFVLVALVGGLGSLLHPAVGAVGGLAVGLAGLTYLLVRDLSHLRIESSEHYALSILQPVRQHDIYPLNPAALAPENALTVCQEIMYRRPRQVLEMGSGSSTLMIASCLARLGGERKVFSLEHGEFWRDDTQAKIDQAGLGEISRVIYAPLVEVEGQPMPRYYDLSKLPEDAGPFELVLVDGPEGGNRNPLARYGALSLLRERLAPGALLLVDDALRPGEQEVVRRWRELVPGAKVTFLRSKGGLLAVELPDQAAAVAMRPVTEAP